MPTLETGAEKQKIEILLGSPLACAMRLHSYLQKARRVNRGIHEKVFDYVEKKTKLEGFEGIDATYNMAASLRSAANSWWMVVNPVWALLDNAFMCVWSLF